MVTTWTCTVSNTPPFLKITGWKPIIDHAATGAAAKSYREKHGIKGRAVARKMGMCPSHFSEIESGKRGWNGDKAVRYWHAVEALKG